MIWNIITVSENTSPMEPFTAFSQSPSLTVIVEKVLGGKAKT